MFRRVIILYHRDIIAHWIGSNPTKQGVNMLPEIHLNDTIKMRKPHPCGSYHWKVTRLGADIGLECLGCGRRTMLTRRKLARRLKQINPSDAPQEPPE